MPVFVCSTLDPEESKSLMKSINSKSTTLVDDIDNCDFFLFVIDEKITDVYDDYMVEVAEIFAMSMYYACKMPKSTFIVLKEDYVTAEMVRSHLEVTGCNIFEDIELAIKKLNDYTKFIDTFKKGIQDGE
jgi:hypothetical protein